MKHRTYLPLFIIVLMLFACKKDKSGTTYKTLGTYDILGKPNYLLKDSISSSLLSFVKNTLPDHVNLTIAHPELFTNTATADITITTTSDVHVTFVSESCGATNSLAFYTYPTNQPPATASNIKLITYVFPSSGNFTALKAGDKAKIGRFDAGTSIGFVFMPSAWDYITHKLNNNVVSFYSNDALNPEVDPKLKRHAVLINYAPENKTLIGFKDTNRENPLCDNDFNDLVIYPTITP